MASTSSTGFDPGNTAMVPSAYAQMEVGFREMSIEEQMSMLLKAMATNAQRTSTLETDSAELQGRVKDLTTESGELKTTVDGLTNKLSSAEKQILETNESANRLRLASLKKEVIGFWGVESPWSNKDSRWSLRILNVILEKNPATSPAEIEKAIAENKTVRKKLRSCIEQYNPGEWWMPRSRALAKDCFFNFAIRTLRDNPLISWKDFHARLDKAGKTLDQMIRNEKNVIKPENVGKVLFSNINISAEDLYIAQFDGYDERKGYYYVYHTQDDHFPDEVVTHYVYENYEESLTN